MKKIGLLSGLLVLGLSAQAQIYSSLSETGFRQNPANTNTMVFDDACIINATVGGNNALNVTQVKFGIRRLANAPAVDINTYNIDFVRALYTRLGVVSLAANGATSVTQVVTIGNGTTTLVSPLFRLTDSAGFNTVHFGVRFSNIDGNNGWRITNYPTGNTTSTWRFGTLDTTTNAVTNFNFTGSTPGCFYLEVFGNTTLPVELLDFKGHYADNANHLAWRTVSEKDNDYFEIQRSINGDSWETVGQVKGNGTTYKTQDYAFSDERVLANQIYYYRLVDHATDGKVGVSKTVTIETGDVSKVIRHYVKGNPVRTDLAIDAQFPTQDDVVVTVQDVSGRVVKQEKFSALPAGEFLFEYEVNSWESGAYIYTIQTAKGLSATGKFVKQ